VCLSSCMVLGGSALGDNPTPASTQMSPAGTNWCSQHREECQQHMQLDSQQIEAYCKRNPSDKRCEKLKQYKQYKQSGKDTKPKASPPPRA
jgi:hypothetical protein